MDFRITIEIRPGLDVEVLDAFFDTLNSVVSGWVWNRYSFDVAALIPVDLAPTKAGKEESDVGAVLASGELTDNAEHQGLQGETPAQRRANPPSYPQTPEELARSIRVAMLDGRLVGMSLDGGRFTIRPEPSTPPTTQPSDPSDPQPFGTDLLS